MTYRNEENNSNNFNKIITHRDRRVNWKNGDKEINVKSKQPASQPACHLTNERTNLSAPLYPHTTLCIRVYEWTCTHSRTHKLSLRLCCHLRFHCTTYPSSSFVRHIIGKFKIITLIAFETSENIIWELWLLKMTLYPWPYIREVSEGVGQYCNIFF